MVTQESRRDPACSQVGAWAERLIDGEIDRGLEAAVRQHMAACPSCRARFMADLALVASVREAPEEALASVSGEVLARVRSHERRVFALRWGGVVATVCACSAFFGAYGPTIFGWLSALAARAAESGSVATAGRVSSALKMAAVAVAGRIPLGTLSADLGPYRGQITMMVGCAGVLVLALMYLMGIWLRKPKEARTWGGPSSGWRSSVWSLSL